MLTAIIVSSTQLLTSPSRNWCRETRKLFQDVMTPSSLRTSPAVPAAGIPNKFCFKLRVLRMESLEIWPRLERSPRSMFEENNCQPQLEGPQHAAGVR